MDNTVNHCLLKKKIIWSILQELIEEINTVIVQYGGKEGASMLKSQVESWPRCQSKEETESKSESDVWLF